MRISICIRSKTAHLFILLLMVTGLIAQPVQKTGAPKKYSFSIRGHLLNMNKKAIVYLGWQEPGEVREFLKADVINGEFKLAGEMSQPTLGMIRIVTYSDSMKPEQNFPWECDRREIFICTGNTKIAGTDSLSTAAIISPCRENELLAQLNETISP